MVLIVLVYILFLVVSLKIEKNVESISAYECGFNPIFNSRKTFSYRFFLISILFLIFDVEISLILGVPILVGERVNLLIFLIFILVLLVGVIYEYIWGSLDWLE